LDTQLFHNGAKEADMESKSRKPSTESSNQAEPPDVPERWSAPHKTEVVLRLLRGEPLDAVSRESQVPAHELEGWQRAFLEAGSRGLKRQSDSDDRELLRTRAKLGELMMRLELAEGLIERKGYGAEWKKHTP
jgi:transposase